MTELFHAEWMKINGNRYVAGMLVWIFPVGTITFLSLALIPALTSDLFKLQVNANPPTWTMQTLLPWAVINSLVTRLALIGFAADVFAGEYQRSMWKNLLPRRRRAPLILMKFFTMSLMLLIAFILACIISGLLSGVVVRTTGAPYELTRSGETLDDFARAFGLNALVAYASALIAASFAALGGILTRSILGAVGFGAVCTVAEQGMLALLFMLGNLLQVPQIIGLYKFTPGYNLSNITSWATNGTAFSLPPLDMHAGGGFSAEVSLLLVVAWVVGLIGLTVWWFRRQDITT
jgi:ABC-type transport system involved in multi-copper enzyme maturation permease subunit